MCNICSFIGFVKSINDGAPSCQRRQIKNRASTSKVKYNFGNSQIFLQREDAKDELLKR